MLGVSYVAAGGYGFTRPRSGRSTRMPSAAVARTRCRSASAAWPPAGHHPRLRTAGAWPRQLTRGAAWLAALRIDRSFVCTTRCGSYAAAPAAGVGGASLLGASSISGAAAMGGRFDDQPVAAARRWAVPAVGRYLPRAARALPGASPQPCWGGAAATGFSSAADAAAALIVLMRRAAPARSGLLRRLGLLRHGRLLRAAFGGGTTFSANMSPPGMRKILLRWPRDAFDERPRDHLFSRARQLSSARCVIALSSSITSLLWTEQLGYPL